MGRAKLRSRWPGTPHSASASTRQSSNRMCWPDMPGRRGSHSTNAFGWSTRPLTERRANPGGWVGVDRGLSAFAVAATAVGREVARIDDAPKALAAGMRQQQHLAKKLSHKKKDRATAARPLPGLPATTTTSATFAGISCTRCPASWSRPTTGSSSKTSTCPGCWPTTGSHERSATPAGPNSPYRCAARPTGAPARSRSPTAGTRQARSAVARLPTGQRRAVVDALVADQRLQQLDRRAGEIRGHGS